MFYDLPKLKGPGPGILSHGNRPLYFPNGFSQVPGASKTPGLAADAGTPASRSDESNCFSCESPKTSEPAPNPTQPGDAKEDAQEFDFNEGPAYKFKAGLKGLAVAWAGPPMQFGIVNDRMPRSGGLACNCDGKPDDSGFPRKLAGLRSLAGGEPGFYFDKNLARPATNLQDFGTMYYWNGGAWTGETKTRAGTFQIGPAPGDPGPAPVTVYVPPAPPAPEPDQYHGHTIREMSDLAAEITTQTLHRGVSGGIDDPHWTRAFSVIREAIYGAAKAGTDLRAAGEVAAVPFRVEALTPGPGFKIVSPVGPRVAGEPGLYYAKDFSLPYPAPAGSLMTLRDKLGAVYHWDGSTWKQDPFINMSFIPEGPGFGWKVSPATPADPIVVGSDQHNTDPGKPEAPTPTVQIGTDQHLTDPTPTPAAPTAGGIFDYLKTLVSSPASAPAQVTVNASGGSSSTPGASEAPAPEAPKEASLFNNPVAWILLGGMALAFVTGGVKLDGVRK